VAGVSVQSWKSYRRDTIAAMEKEELMMTAVFILVGVITVFIVFVIFYMIVSHKLKDIGILKSFGASTGSVVRLFSGFAALTGLIGALAGISAGLLFLEHINEVELWLYNKYGFQIWDRTMYMIDDIPNELNIELLVVVAMAAVTACVAGAFFPSLKAGRLKCVDSLRVNGL
jgi:lipoprotein-releasing system permease protein